MLLLWSTSTVLVLLEISFTFASLLTDYDDCKSKGFGNTSLICDIHGLLSHNATVQLVPLLNDLQEKVHCHCEKGCTRANGNDKFIGLLVVTEQERTKNDQLTVADTAKHIYQDANLGNPKCDNGLLIIYFNDTNQLATYQGGDTYNLLSDADINRLHRLASINPRKDDVKDLQEFLMRRRPESEPQEVERAETWGPLIGLFVALLLILLVLLILLCLLWCCCCCKRRRKLDEIPPPVASLTPTYRAVAPLFIATPPAMITERYQGSRSDVIYSTPYAGTPSPASQHHLASTVPRLRAPPVPPPHLASFGTLPPRSPRIPIVSQPVTPVSTHRSRLHYLNTSARGVLPPLETSKIRKVNDSTQTVDEESVRDTSREPSSATLKGSSFLPRSPEMEGSRRTSNYAESDLSFLDPRRKLETQTREDFIY